MEGTIERFRRMAEAFARFAFPSRFEDYPLEDFTEPLGDAESIGRIKV